MGSVIPVNMLSARDVRDLYAEVCTDEEDLDDIEAKWRWLLNHPECALVRSLLEHGFMLTFDSDAFDDYGVPMFDVTWENGNTDTAVRVRLGWPTGGQFACTRAEWRQRGLMYWRLDAGCVTVGDIVEAAIELKEMVANREQ